MQIKFPGTCDAFFLIVVAIFFGVSAAVLSLKPAGGEVYNTAAKQLAGALREYTEDINADIDALVNTIRTVEKRGLRRHSGAQSNILFSGGLLRRNVLAEEAKEHNVKLTASMVSLLEDVAEEVLYGELVPTVFPDSGEHDSTIHESTVLTAPLFKLFEVPRMPADGSVGRWATECKAMKSSHFDNRQGYTSIHELLAHMARDWAPLSNPASEAVHRFHYDVLIQRIVETLVVGNRTAVNATVSAKPSILVPGSGAGGLLHKLRLVSVSNNSLFGDVLGTECSVSFLALQLWLHNVFQEATEEERDDDDEERVSTTFFPWASHFANIKDGTEVDEQFASYNILRTMHENGTSPAPSLIEVGDLLASLVAASRGAPAGSTNRLFDFKVPEDGNDGHFGVIVGDMFSPNATPPNTSQGLFDVVVTSFLIDAVTGNMNTEGESKSRKKAADRYEEESSISSDGGDFMDVLDRIDAFIKPGGLWANVGPLHFHHVKIYPKFSYRDVMAYFIDALGYEAVLPSELDEGSTNSVDLCSSSSWLCLGNNTAVAQVLSDPPVPYARPLGSSLTPQVHDVMMSVLRKPRQ